MKRISRSLGYDAGGIVRIVETKVDIPGGYIYVPPQYLNQYPSERNRIEEKEVMRKVEHIKRIYSKKNA